jgi:hypothetical protein
LAKTVTIERMCAGVQGLLLDVHSTLRRVCKHIVPGSQAASLVEMLGELAVKPGGEDPVATSVQAQVMTGSASTLSMLMMHGVECNWDTVSTSFPVGGKNAKSISGEASRVAAQLVSFVAAKKAEKAADKAPREAKKSSSQATKSVAP